MSAPWSGADIKRLKYLYPTLSLADLAIAFWPRSENSVRQMAQVLGLRKKKRDWKAIAQAHCPVFNFRIMEDAR